jgi:hypothetical protein
MAVVHNSNPGSDSWARREWRSAKTARWHNVSGSIQLMRAVPGAMDGDMPSETYSILVDPCD